MYVVSYITLLQFNLPKNQNALNFGDKWKKSTTIINW